MLKMSSITLSALEFFLLTYFTYSVKLFLKLWTALFIGPAENCTVSSPVQLLIHKLF